MFGLEAVCVSLGPGWGWGGEPEGQAGRQVQVSGGLGQAHPLTLTHSPTCAIWARWGATEGQEVRRPSSPPLPGLGLSCAFVSGRGFPLTSEPASLRRWGRACAWAETLGRGPGQRPCHCQRGGLGACGEWGAPLV